jgi:hypothetical protein
MLHSIICFEFSPLGHFDQSFGFDSDTNGLIKEAKRDLQKDLEILSTKGRPPGTLSKDGSDSQLMDTPEFESDDDGMFETLQ